MNTPQSLNHNRRSLREILQSPELTLASSVFDPISARLAQHIGAECGVLGGSVASQVILGAPDLILLTASELVEQARRICRTNTVELIVDADHGYGNALNTMRTVQDLQAAGVAGICLEDSRLPREFDAETTNTLISIEEHAAKLRAALEARGQGPMQILARTNAIDITGLDDTVERLCHYEALGVDALFVPYLRDREQLDAIANRVSLPIILVGADASLFDRDYLNSRRVKIWMWGHQPLAHAIKTLHDAMLAAHQGCAPKKLPTQSDPRLTPIITAEEDYQTLTAKYLRR